MVSIRFARLAVGLFLLAFATLRDYSMVHTHQEVLTMANRNGFVVVGVNDASIDQGLIIATNAWLKGRKMMMKERIKGDALKITGKGNYALEKSFERSGTNVNDEIRSNMLKTKSLNYDGMGTIGSSHEPVDEPDTQQLKPQVSEATSTHGSLETSSSSKASVSQAPLDPTHTTESQKLLEAAMVTMLSMDYDHKPRRTPPINNDQPLNGKLTKP